MGSYGGRDTFLFLRIVKREEGTGILEKETYPTEREKGKSSTQTCFGRGSVSYQNGSTKSKSFLVV